jgi:hypothetical protein
MYRSVNIMTGYGLDGRDFIREQGQEIYFLYRTQTGSGALLASYPISRE